MHTILALLFHTLTWLNLIIHITPAQTWLNPIGRNPCCSDVPLLSSLFLYKSTHSKFSVLQASSTHLSSRSQEVLVFGLYIAAVDKFSNWLCGVRSYLTQSVGYLCICAYNTYTCIIHSQLFSSISLL